MNTLIPGSNQVTQSEIARLLSTYRITAEDLLELQQLGGQLADSLDEIINEFYQWLGSQPSWEMFFSDPGKTERLKKQQKHYWHSFFSGVIDSDYIKLRRQVGATHAQVGLPLPDYFAAMSTFQEMFLKHFKGLNCSQMKALNRLLMMDSGITVEMFNIISNQTIADQSKAMMEMGTPITAIWEDILLLPIVGIIDSGRAQDIMDAMLNKVAKLQTRVFILDISGVAVVDTAVANHIIKMTKATSLMGCKCVMSGISPSIAQTMVELGIEVGNVKTTSNLKDALKYAFRLTGVSITANQDEEII